VPKRIGHGCCVILAGALIVSLFFSLPLPLHADNGRLLVVCPQGCPYSSIGAALAQANPGDTVQVGPGIYPESITMRPGVVIRGQGNNASIVTGGDRDTVVRAYGTAIDRSAVLEGLTIIAGRAFTGGGIEIRGGASPTIRNNLITANSAGPTQSYGGGIFVSGGAPLITANVFSGNRSSYGGGAIAIWDDSRAVVSDNYFECNRADYYGGAINVTRSAPTITGNTIISGTAYNGGAVDMSQSAGEFENNILRGNLANLHGGGLYLRDGSSPSIFANTFMSNTAYYYGGGLYMDRSSASVSGNSFQYNIADSGGGIYVDRSPAMIARNSILFNDASYHGGGIHVHGSAAVIDNNNINYNTSIVGGGGLGIDGHAMPLVVNNTIAGNAVGVQGGAVYIEGAAPNLINNMIARNSSSNIGGGIYVDNATPLIRNNTIIDNGTAGNGEGIYLSAQAFPTITNNIIVGNGYGIFSVTNYSGSGLRPVVINNNSWNNRSGDFVGMPSANNLSADPLFVRGRDGAYYLSQRAAGQSVNSPAVDAGTGSATDLGLANRTTAVRDFPDAGTVDLGYHYRALFYRSFIPIIVTDRP